jgi:hypothetical protein
MATKQIPFSLEMVKKIQAGEVKGIIKTGDGRAARFICEIRNNKYPLLFICSNERGEWAFHYTIDGCFDNLTGEHAEYNLILEIEDEQKKPEHQFKPFDKVLGRNGDNRIWEPDFFASYSRISNFRCYCIGSVYEQCIPYEGNEHLLGTTDKPKED